MQCFMKKEDKRLIHVENIEPTYFDNCAFFAALAYFLLQFCLIHLSLASLAFCATYFTFLSGVFVALFCWRYTKTLPKCHFTIFNSLWGSSHDICSGAQ